MKTFSKVWCVPAIFSLAGLAACGSSSSNDTAAASNTGTTRTPGNSTVQATNVSELGLTGALSIELPAALSEGSSLRLAGSKSMEACLMRESAKQLVQQIDMATNMLCHIEVEGANIPWNTPVILDFSAVELALAARKSSALKLQDPGIPPGGPGDMPPGGPTGGDAPTGDAPTGEMPGGEGDFAMPIFGLYVKEADGGNVEVYLCSGEDEDNMTLTQTFKVTGSKTITVDGKSVAVSKGKVNISMDDFGTFKGAIAYDSQFTDADATALSMEVKFGFDGASFAQKFSISSKEDGNTKVSISEVGSMSFGGGDAFEFKNAGVGLFDAENGHVFYSYDGGAQEFSTKACVDANSYLVDCSGAKFLDNGSLALTKDDVPGVLPATFSPEAPTGFDCKPASWTKVAPKTDATAIAAHEACDAGLMAQAESGATGMASCFSGEGYAQSSEVVEIQFEEVPEGTFEPELPPAE